MRKILIGALSVAGLLATVLALASSPATSQVVVTITTDDIPGTYTVDWATQGGCDPSKPDPDTTIATDGASGSISRTVGRPAGTDGNTTVSSTDFDADVAGDQRGEAIEFAVAVGGHCNYDFTASFVSNLPGDEGTRCAPVAGARDGKLDTDLAGDFDPRGGDPVRNAFIFDIAAGECAAGGAITVTISPTPSAAVSAGGVEHTHTHADVAGDPSEFGSHTHTHTNPDVNHDHPLHVHDGLVEHGHTHASGDAGAPATYNDSGRYLLADPTVGAILNTTFTVTATPVKDSDDECQAVTEETEVDDNDTLTRNDDSVVAKLNVLAETLELSKPCEYDVVAELPAGFDHVPGRPESNEIEVTEAVFNGAGTPATVLANATDCAADPVPTGTDCVPYDPPVSLHVTVAKRSIYILQNVVGDSGGANARYKLDLDTDCAIPSDLPRNLTGTGGIVTTPAVTVVELREGFFNISAAVMGRHTTDIDNQDRTYAPRYALNADGEPCSFTAKVSHLPDICDAAEESITVNAVTGADSHGRVITTFDIGCEEPMDDEDAMPTGGEDVEEAMPTGGEDAGEEMVDDDPMPTGGEDAGEEMVDDDGMGEMDDGDAMGPPPDEPTG